MNRDRAVAGSSFLSAEGGSFGGDFRVIELSSWADADVVKPSVRLKENSRTRRTKTISSNIVDTFAERENLVITYPLRQKKYHQPVWLDPRKLRAAVSASEFLVYKLGPL